MKKAQLIAWISCAFKNPAIGIGNGTRKKSCRQGNAKTPFGFRA
jgi:hypothetical protein